MGRILLRHVVVSRKPKVIGIDSRTGRSGDSVFNRKVVQTLLHVLAVYENLRIWPKIRIMRILTGIENKISRIHTEIQD